MKVYIIAAISADGFIAKSSNELINWTSKEDKQFFREMTKKSGVMVMGGNTFRTFKSPLPGRRTIVYTTSHIDHKDVEVTDLAPKDLLEKLQNEGVSEVAICGGSSIYDMFLAADVVTDVYLTIEPLIFGEGISLIRSDAKIRLNLEEVKNLNDNTLLLHYKVKK